VFELIYMRSFGALIIMSIFIYFSSIKLFNIPRNLQTLVFFRVIFSLLGFLFECMATEYIAISKVVIFAYNPFITSIQLYLLLGETLSIYDFASFGMCLIGVIILTDPFSEENSSK